MTDDVNKIKFSIPVHVLNSEAVAANVKRTLGFGLKLGDKKIWSALHEINLLDYKPAADTPQTPTIVSSVRGPSRS